MWIPSFWMVLSAISQVFVFYCLLLMADSWYLVALIKKRTLLDEY